MSQEGMVMMDCDSNILNRQISLRNGLNITKVEASSSLQLNVYRCCHPYTSGHIVTMNGHLYCLRSGRPQIGMLMLKQDQPDRVIELYSSRNVPVPSG